MFKYMGKYYLFLDPVWKYWFPRFESKIYVLYFSYSHHFSNVSQMINDISNYDRDLFIYFSYTTFT